MCLETAGVNGVVGPTPLGGLETRGREGVGTRYGIAGGLGRFHRRGRPEFVGPVAAGAQGTP